MIAATPAVAAPAAFPYTRRFRRPVGIGRPETVSTRAR